MPRNRYAAVVAAIAATTVTAGLGGAGLAVAGVNLPDGASDAFERAGVTLPNQDGEESARSSDAVRAILRDTPPSERDGCSFGQQIAEAARGSALPQQAKDACAQAGQRREAREETQAERREAQAERKAAKEQAQAERRAAKEQARSEKDARRDSAAATGAAEEGATQSTFGREQSQRAKQQRTATAQQRRQFGAQTAERARQRAQNRGANADATTKPENPGPSPQRGGRPDSAGSPKAKGRPDFAGPPAGVGRP